MNGCFDFHNESWLDEVGKCCLVSGQQRSIITHCYTLGNAASCLFRAWSMMRPYTRHLCTSRPRDSLCSWSVSHIYKECSFLEGLYTEADKLCPISTPWSPSGWAWYGSWRVTVVNIDFTQHLWGISILWYHRDRKVSLFSIYRSRDLTEVTIK